MSLILMHNNTYSLSAIHIMYYVLLHMYMYMYKTADFNISIHEAYCAIHGFSFTYFYFYFLDDLFRPLEQRGKSMLIHWYQYPDRYVTYSHVIGHVTILCIL